MKSIIIKILICCFTFSSIPTRAFEEIPRLHDEYDPAKWPEANLRLSQAATLKDMFDSGLRPYRFPGLENTTLEVKHLNLSVLLGSGKRLPNLQMEWMNIKIFTDGELATIEAATPKLTIELARSEMLKWLPYTANGRTEKDLDEYLAAAKADFLDFDDPYRGIPHGCSINWKEPEWKTKRGGPQVTAWFRKTAGQSHPLKLYFKISWGSNRVIKDSSTLHDGPISPPPGYEHVDMTAPKNFGPDSMVNILRSKGVDIGDGNSGIPYNEYLASIGEKPLKLPSPPAPEISAPDESLKISLWWWLLAGIALAATTFGFRKWLTRKNK